MVIDALANDTDLQGNSFTITHVTDKQIIAGGSAVTLASGGSVTLGTDGKLTYTPANNSGVTDVFTYTVSDGTGMTAVGFINVDITAPLFLDLNDNGTTSSRDHSASFAEGGAAVSVASTTASVFQTVTPADTAYGSLNIALGGFVDTGSEIVNIGGTPFAFGTAQTSNISVSGVALVVAYNGSNAFSVTRMGGTDIPDQTIEFLIRGITYQDTGLAVTAGARTLNFTVIDGPTASNTAVSTITVTSVNVVPTLDLNGNDTGSTTNVRDQFDTTAYSNNNGSANWSTNWTENAETTDAAAGDIRIVSDTGVTPNRSVLRFNDTDNVTQSIQRSANLSGALSAVLSMDYRRVQLDDSANDYVAIEVSTNGTTFTEVGRITGPTNDAAYQTFSVDISAYISATTVVRLVSPGSLGGGGSDVVYIDNVNIVTTLPTPTGYSTSYQIGEPAAAIAATVGVGAVVTDPDANVNQAVITLTNPQTGDALSVLSSLPPGITAAISGGGTIVTLSGLSTSSNYETAIQSIGFANNNQSASLAARSITVRLTDATSLSSNTATTTISMVANTAPTLDLDGSAAGSNFSASYTENGAAAAIADTDAAIVDADDTNMESGSIVLTNKQTGDQFLIGGTPVANGATGTINGIAYTVTETAGQITIALSGPATKAVYASTLAQIAFANTTDNPDTTARSVSVTVNDGAANTNTSVTTITVTAVNDAPVLDLDGSAAGTGYAVTYTENGTSVAIADADIAITDVDNATLTGATITLTNAQTGDVLAAGSMPAGITASVVGNVVTLSRFGDSVGRLPDRDQGGDLRLDVREPQHDGALDHGSSDGRDDAIGHGDDIDCHQPGPRSGQRYGVHQRRCLCLG